MRDNKIKIFYETLMEQSQSQTQTILDPNNRFDFSKLCLAQPVGIQGGAYFTKFLYDSKPFYIETPKCLTKQGFIKHGKKIYTELMFDNSDSQFIQWIEKMNLSGENWTKRKYF